MSDKEEKLIGRFPPPPGAPAQSVPKPPPQNRFAAVADELDHDAIAPAPKPPPPVSLEPVKRAPRLFDEPIRIVDGMMTPCPKCGCQVFEMAKPGNAFVTGVGPMVLCRCCPLPPPSYSLDLGGRNTPLRTVKVRCGACGKKTDVTTSVDHVNLYCYGCNRLALHDTFNGLAGIMVKEK